MTNTIIRSGGRPPTNQFAANTYNPIAGGTAGHPTEYPIGTPVVPSQVDDGTVIPGRANAETTSLAVGMTAGRAVVGGDVLVQLDGPLHLTTAQWDAVTGGSGGLVAGTPYYLSADVEGLITDVIPINVGEFVVPVGVALSSTDLLIKTGSPAAAGGSITTDASFAMRYGFTAGTGSSSNEYASTIAAGSVVPFIHNVVFGTAITTTGTGGLLVHVDGWYEISWTVTFLEESQVEVNLTGTITGPVNNTCSTSSAGAVNTNTVIVELFAETAVTIINPTGNGTALTVQTAAGALTHAQAPNLCVRLLAPSAT